MQYRPEIDGLRTLAVVPVILFHAGVGLFSGGFVGVDVFFVISGFLITTIIVQGIEAGTFTYTNFYHRRAKRLLPALFVVMAATIPFSWLWMLPTQHESYAQSLVYVSLFVSNILFWKESGYFSPEAEEKPLLHTWSLAVEEQYYLLFPLLVVFLWRFGRSPSTIVISVIAVLSLWLSQWGSTNKPDANFYLLVSRAWEILLGSLCALSVLNKPKVGNDFIAGVGLLLIWVAIFLFDESVPMPSVYGLIPVMGTGLVLLYATEGTYVAKLLSTRAMVYVGLLSYSLYLWHQPVLAFARVRGLALEEWWVLMTLLGGTALLALMTYHWVELPVKRSQVFCRKKPLLIAVVTILVSFIAYGSFVSNTAFFAKQYPQAAQLLEQMQWPAALSYTEACRGQYGADQYCLVGIPGEKPTAALIGDSHANHFYWGLNDYVKKSGGNLLLLGAGACPPFIGADRGFHPEHGHLNCVDRTQQLFQTVIDDPAITEVYIAFRADEYLREDVELKDVFGQIGGANNFSNTSRFMKRTIGIMQKAGKQVVLIEDMPDLSMALVDCVKQQYVMQSNTGCMGGLVKPMSLKYRQLMAVLSNVPEVIIFPTSEFAKDQFPLSDNGLTYRDQTHLSLLGSMYFSPHYETYFDQYK